MKQKRVLAAPVFDYLAFASLAFDGIGAGKWTDLRLDGTELPRCAYGYGHVLRVQDPDNDPAGSNADWHAVSQALHDAGITTVNSDNAVRAINRRDRRTLYVNDRVPFAQWCAELGVVRGK